ncbi:hypothetical protein, partial [Pseudomonas sp. DSP3-2-2]|uniref:hypothetical protein n=1 Tax=unclassified Pseudomonas TaxID=196821 RepID=UPI003CFB2043
ALDSALRKPDAIREELANATTLDTQPRRRVKGYVSRGQGHWLRRRLPGWKKRVERNNAAFWLDISSLVLF